VVEHGHAERGDLRPHPEGSQGRLDLGQPEVAQGQGA